jgi:hypothetical protein
MANLNFTCTTAILEAQSRLSLKQALESVERFKQTLDGYGEIEELYYPSQNHEWGLEEFSQSLPSGWWVPAEADEDFRASEKLIEAALAKALSAGGELGASDEFDSAKEALLDTALAEVFIQLAVPSPITSTSAH